MTFETHLSRNHIIAFIPIVNVAQARSLYRQDEHGIRNLPNGAKVAWSKDPDGNVPSLSEHAGQHQ